MKHNLLQTMIKTSKVFMENRIRDVLQQMKTILYQRKITITIVMTKARKAIRKATTATAIKTSCNNIKKNNSSK